MSDPTIRTALARVSWKRAAWFVLAAIVAFAIVVVLAKWLRTLPAVEAFVDAYPGEAPLPEWAPVGIPGWVGWQHFFNAFLLVMLVRTGLILRSKQRPPAFWTRDNTRRPRTKRAPRRLGISLWLHLWVEALWVLNGVIYVVLLFATGQWVRIVPTDWSIVPSAASVALQYASLEWPTENAWVVYNALQVLSYFAVVFIAAPLAILTGLRLSPVWPPEGRVARLLSERSARALHFPTMLFLLAFTFVHVVLVFSTGVLRNLNAMYAARDADDWVGFAIFALSIGVMAIGWVLARPLLLVAVAEKSGQVRRMPPAPQAPPARSVDGRAGQPRG
ncbi:cytochrome b/b6 domain-containing protein [Agromyces sp. MMS24-K17]|uniref:cytochrome b/b6 domain-containing protein n=1 Tax=Agromyces sp. MMS24-K17 TaxID=3372850 RepID=UPI00375415C3